MKVKTLCRGPRLIDVVSNKNFEWEKVAKAMGMKPPTRESDVEVLRDAVRSRHRAGHYDRLGCGFETTAIFEKIPRDGEVHEVECPKCGVVAKIQKMPPKLKVKA